MESHQDEVGIRKLIQAVIAQRIAIQKLMRAKGLSHEAKPQRNALSESAVALLKCIPLGWSEGPIDELLTQAFHQRKHLRKHYMELADSFAAFLATYYGVYEAAPKSRQMLKHRKAALRTLDNLDRIDQHYLTMISMEVEIDEFLLRHKSTPNNLQHDLVFKAHRARSRYFKEPKAKQLQRCAEAFDPEHIFGQSEATNLELSSDYQLDPAYLELCDLYDKLSVASMLRIVTE